MSPILITYIVKKTVGEMRMAYQGSKGWYIAKLKEFGVNRHPIELRKLELYKTYEVRKIYQQVLANKKQG